jgi:hypothetical protein
MRAVLTSTGLSTRIADMTGYTAHAGADEATAGPAWQQQERTGPVCSYKTQRVVTCTRQIGGEEQASGRVLVDGPASGRSICLRACFVLHPSAFEATSRLPEMHLGRAKTQTVWGFEVAEVKKMQSWTGVARRLPRLCKPEPRVGEYLFSGSSQRWELLLAVTLGICEFCFA